MYISNKKIFRMEKPNISFRGFKTTERFGNNIWVFHESDADYLPSVLHGHSVDGNYRLDALNGNIYKGKDLNCPKGHLSKHELSALHSNDKFQMFTIKRINWANGHFSRVSFPMPEWVNRPNIVTVNMFRQERKAIFMFSNLYIKNKYVLLYSNQL